MCINSILIILLYILTVGVICNVWSKMERGDRAQPLQLAFHGSPKNRFHNLNTKDSRLCMKSQLHVFIQLSVTYKNLLKKTLSTLFSQMFYLQQWAGWLSRYSDRLWAGQSGDRIPVVARFSAPVQTGPRAHPASCTMGTGSFPGIKSGRGVTLTTHPF